MSSIGNVFGECVTGAITGFGISTMLVGLGIVAVGAPPASVALGIILGATAFGCAMFVLANKNSVTAQTALTITALISALTSEMNDVVDLMTDLNNFINYIYNNSQVIGKGIQYDIEWIVATSINQPFYVVSNYVQKYVNLFISGLYNAYIKFIQNLQNSVYGIYNTIKSAISIIQNAGTFQSSSGYSVSLSNFNITDAGLVVAMVDLYGYTFYVPYGLYITGSGGYTYVYLWSQPQGALNYYSVVTGNLTPFPGLNASIVGYLNYKYLVDPLTGVLLAQLLDNYQVGSSADFSIDNVQIAVGEYAPYGYTAYPTFVLIPVQNNTSNTINISSSFNPTYAFQWANGVYSYLQFLNSYFGNINNFAEQLYNLLQTNGITTPTQAIQYLGLGVLSIAFPSCNPTLMYANQVTLQAVNALLSQQKLKLPNNKFNFFYPNWIYSSSVTINGVTYNDVYLQFMDYELTLPGTTTQGGWLYNPNNNTVVPIPPNTYVNTSSKKRWSTDVWYPDNQPSECNIIPVTQFNSVTPSPNNLFGYILNVNNVTVIPQGTSQQNGYLVSNTLTILYQGTFSVEEQQSITYVPGALAYQTFYGNEIVDTSQVVQQTTPNYLVALGFLGLMVLGGILLQRKIHKSH